MIERIGSATYFQSQFFGIGIRFIPANITVLLQHSVPFISHTIQFMSKLSFKIAATKKSDECYTKLLVKKHSKLLKLLIDVLPVWLHSPGPWCASSARSLSPPTRWGAHLLVRCHFCVSLFVSSRILPMPFQTRKKKSFANNWTCWKSAIVGKINHIISTEHRWTTPMGIIMLLHRSKVSLSAVNNGDSQPNVCVTCSLVCVCVCGACVYRLKIALFRQFLFLSDVSMDSLRIQSKRRFFSVHQICYYYRCCCGFCFFSSSFASSSSSFNSLFLLRCFLQYF